MTDNLENKCEIQLCLVKCFYNNVSVGTKMAMLENDAKEYNQHDTCPGNNPSKPCYRVWPNN